MAILPTICLLGAVNLAGAAYYNPNVVERDEPTTTGPDYYQTSFGPWAGPWKEGSRPFLAQTNPAPFGEPTYIPNAPMVTTVPVKDNSTTDAIFSYMGNLSPYRAIPEGFGVEEQPLPPGANISAIHVIHRHGSRYPTTDSEPDEFVKKFTEFKKKGVKFTEDLAFLNDWEYQLGAEELTARGRQDLFDSGILHWFNYGHLFDPSARTVARTTTQYRMLQSAENFMAGFFGLDWKQNITLEVIIEEEGFNNTLVGANACPNANNERSEGGSAASKIWQKKYLAEATKRFQKWSDPSWTVDDTYNAQTMCPYETVALGYSPFCSLFDWEEWKGFEYSLDLGYHGNNGFGSPTGRAVGIGYVQEVLARLQGHVVDIPAGSSQVNTTLDSNPETFPTGQQIYLDFSHDTNLMSVLTAFGLKQFSAFLPSDGPPKDQQLIVSRLQPFGARFVLEVIKTPRPVCAKRPVHADQSAYEEDDDEETTYVHFVVNQRTIPLGRSFPECGDRDDGWCELKTFLQVQEAGLEKADFEYSCYGNYTVPEYGDVDDGVITKEN